MNAKEMNVTASDMTATKEISQAAHFKALTVRFKYSFELQRTDSQLETCCFVLMGTFIPTYTKHFHRHQLVPPEQVAREDLLGNVGEVLAPAVGDDDVAAPLEGIEVARDLGAEEVAAAVRRIVHQHGHALGLHALHDVLDRGGAEVVGPGLHGEAEHADQRLGRRRAKP